MAKITRETQLLFGSTAGANQMSEFGSLAAGAAARYSGSTITPAIIQTLSNYLDGWLAAVIGGNSPAIEDWNSICYLFAYQLAYAMQAGIPEWDSATIYYAGSLVTGVAKGTVYVSLSDDNTGNAVTDDSYWAFKDGGIAKSANFTASALAGGYLVDTSGGNVIATLPVASTSAGSIISFKNKTFGGANHIAITPDGTDQIEGANAATNLNDGEFMKLFCNGTAWFIWNA